MAAFWVTGVVIIGTGASGVSRRLWLRERRAVSFVASCGAWTRALFRGVWFATGLMWSLALGILAGWLPHTLGLAAVAIAAVGTAACFVGLVAAAALGRPRAMVPPPLRPSR